MKTIMSRTCGCVVVLALVATQCLTVSLRTAEADPVISDLGNGNKTAEWRFSTPSDYAATNVVLSGDAAIIQEPGPAFFHDTTQDFEANNLTWDSANLTIGGGLISTTRQSAELVADGGFDSGPPWRYDSSAGGNLTAARDAVNMAGRFANESRTPSRQFDGMEAVGPWSGVSGGNFVTNLIADGENKTEGMASLRLTIDFMAVASNWAGVQRVGPWDWSQYDSMSMWLDTNYTGPQKMEAYLDLGPPEWISAHASMISGWQRYEFDMTGNPNRNSVTNFQIRFTNITNTASVLVWIDDIWLYRHHNLTATASISQDITKDNFTSPAPGTLFLDFDYTVNSTANIDANITANIGAWSSPPSPANVTLPWTHVSLDVSSALAGRGTFNLSFVVDLGFDTPFNTSLDVRIDNVSIIIPIFRGGVYLSKVFDLGRAYFMDFVFFASSSHPDTNVTLEVRGGWTGDTADGSWTPWEQHYSSPEPLLNQGTASFLQYRVSLSTANSSAAVSFDSVTLTFHRYHDGGSVETAADFGPAEPLVGWRRFNASETVPPATSVSYFLSDDSGTSWFPVSPGASLNAVGGSSVRIRANLSTANTTFTPRVHWFDVTYEYVGPLFTIAVSPAFWSMRADQQFQFTATAKDEWGHGVTPFNPTWTENDPGGTVTNGLYSPGTPGAWVVCASYGGKIDCANVTVSVGALSAITISPSAAAVEVGGRRQFTATGEDSDGNPVALTTTMWSTDVGYFVNETLTTAVLVAGSVPVFGFVLVANGTVFDQAPVTVTASTSVVIQGTVPDQQAQEDSPPWSLDLNPYLPPSQDPDDLMWRVEDADASLYSILGDRRFGQHLLVFSPKKDAFGVDQATIVLENRTGATDSQPLQVTISPVDDPPVFYGVSDFQVKAGSHRTFDYTPYIFDVDTPSVLLTLTSDDPAHATVQGLSVDYLYDPSFIGKKVLVKLNVSDGVSSAQTVQSIDVVGGDNTCPHIVKPIPPIAMSEDVPDDDAFPEVLTNYFGDTDGDTLTFSVSATQHILPRLHGTYPSIMVNVTSSQDWFGIESVRIRATDPSGCFAEQTARIEVSPVNDPPVLAWQDDVYIKYDLLYDLDLTDFISDVDNAQSELTLAANNTDLAAIERFTVHLFASTSEFGGVSRVALSLSLTDGIATVWSNITVRIGQNAPPALRTDIGIPDVFFPEDTQRVGEFDLDDYFVDTDGPQPLAYSLIAGTVIVQVDSRDNSVNVSAPPNWCGHEAVLVKAGDGLGFALGKFFVNVICVDDAPVIDPIPDQDMGTGGHVAIDLRLYVHDVDNNITELIFSTDSPRAVIVGYILVLDYDSGSPSETVTLTANDTQKQASRQFSVTVAPVKPDEKPLDLILIAAIAAVATVALLAVLLAMRRRSAARSFTVDDAFIVGKEGRLMMHKTRTLRADTDEDILAGMLTAIQMFIKDSFGGESGDLKSFQFGDKQVLVDMGRHFYFAAIYSGQPPEQATESMKEFTTDVEAHFGPVLEAWSGDADEVSGLRSFLDAFVSRRKYRKGDWKKHVKGK